MPTLPPNPTPTSNNALPQAPVADKLTPSLTQQQLEENITAMQKQKVDNATIQSYVNNYSKNDTGYILKGTLPTNQKPFNPNNPNGQFEQPSKGPTMDYSKDPGTNASSHIFSGTKDALGDIFVKPEQKLIADAGTRIAQVGGQVSNEFQNPGYDTPVDYGNPQRKNAGGQATPLPPNLPPQGVNTHNLETKIALPQNQLGVTVQPQQQGMEGAKQIGGQALNAADAIGNVAMASEVLPKLATKGFQAAKSGIDTLGTLKENFNTASQIKNDAASLAKIQENISPKMTLKETKLALKEGRLVEGQDPTLLRNGTPDSVIPSTKTQQAAQTIQEQIPGAEKMKQSELFAALNKNGVALRDNLVPIMKQTPVTDETLQTINDGWKALKAQQKADPYLSNGVNISKLQANFEKNFLMKSGNKTMNDLWETTQAYDASVPQNVKSATSLSSQELQDQKAIWLQNRKILTDATHNVSTGLDTTSQKAFSSMSDMYTAKENILSKVKIDKTGGIKGISQWIEKNPWKSAGIGYLANKVARNTGLPSLPLP